jgi:DNA-binding XRE family transcriptional regulator
LCCNHTLEGILYKRWPWQVDFFVDERGSAPVEEYLTTLPAAIAGGRHSHRGSADGAAWAAAGRKKEMTNRWKRFYQKQMEDAKLRELVESELENLQLGVQIAKLRAEENLSQTKLAAKAEMSAPKISAMENEPRNLTIGTLIRVAHALDSRVEIKLVRRKRTKAGRGRRPGGKV